MASPRVSVVIPLFNGMAHIGALMESLKAQSRPAAEIVICDGGSHDGSLEWLRSLDIPGLVKDELPFGSSAAETWTRCSSLASGDYVKLVCQDDILFPKALEVQAEDLANHPECNIAIGQRDIIDAQGRAIAHARGCQGLAPGVNGGLAALRASYLRGTNVFGEPVTTMYRREAMTRALPWIDDQPYVLDIAFNTRILEATNVFVRKEAVGAFRVSSSSWSTQLARHQRNQFRTWQTSTEVILEPLSLLDRLRGALGLELQTQLRRATYAYLRLRRGLS